MSTAGFPLPLTPFERYMVLDNRAAYPMTMLGQVDFDGVFRKDLLEKAVARALERHPMLRTTVRGRRVWRQPVPADTLSAVRWLPWSEETPAEALERIDIGREIGIRIFLQQNAERSRCTLAAHHAATDGQGGPAAVDRSPRGSGSRRRLSRGVLRKFSRKLSTYVRIPRRIRAPVAARGLSSTVVK